MINVGLIDVDNTEKVSFPNLVLMKASTYYKNKEYNVKLIHGKLLDQYNKEYLDGATGDAHREFFPDIVIKSKVFTWTEDKNLLNGNTLLNKSEYYFGGTGSPDITLKINPEIDMCYPDYSLYKGKFRQHSEKFENVGMGFITRGCTRHCDFCFVPKKEGMIKKYMHIEDFKKKESNKLILLDNNILAHKHGIREIKRMRDMGLEVDFNQGLDPYIIASNDKIAELLSGLNWINQIRLACDEQKDKKALKEAVRKLRELKIKADIHTYTIITPDVEESYDRLKFIDSLGVVPCAQSLRNKENTPPTNYMLVLQKWVSSGIVGVYYALTFEEYLNIMLVYDNDAKKFREVENRAEISKQWIIKNKGQKRERRSMELGNKTIKEIVDKRMEEGINQKQFEKEIKYKKFVNYIF
jgi:hypothetical protein